MHSTFQQLAAHILLSHFILQSCDSQMNFPNLLTDPPILQACPDDLTTPEEKQQPILQESQVFTAASGQTITFIQEQDTWQGVIQDGYSNLMATSKLPVFCSKKATIVFQLANLSKQNQSIHKNQIHVLPSKHGKYIFLGTLGLPGGIQEEEMKEFPTNNMQLYEAVVANDLQRLDAMLVAGVDVNIQDEDGATLLYWAADKGHLAIVERLLTKGADPNIQAQDGATPLYVAAWKGYTQIAELLLNKDADPTLAYEDGWTPLHEAAENGHKYIAELLLLSNDTDPNFKNEDSLTPLHLAAKNGHIAIVQLLLNKGAKPNLADEYGITPLHEAAENGHIAIVQLLLNKGADPNVADKYGCTPLHWAADKGYRDIIKVLLKANACINNQNNDGKTFLHIIMDKKNPELTSQIMQAIQKRHRYFLKNLQESMCTICPELSNDDSLPILTEIVNYDYIQGIAWDLKNHQGKTLEQIKVTIIK